MLTALFYLSKLYVHVSVSIYSNNKRLRPDDGLPAHQEAEEEKLLSENKLCVQTSRLTFERGAPPLSGVQSI